MPERHRGLLRFSSEWAGVGLSCCAVYFAYSSLVKRSLRDYITSMFYLSAMEKFGEIVKRLRLEKRMSQAELGDVVGVTRAAVHQWEKNGVVPSLVHIGELARFFGVSLAYMIGAPQTDVDSIDAELRQLPPDVAALLKASFLNTIRGLKPLKSDDTGEG